jgi:hypothetical protein
MKKRLLDTLVENLAASTKRFIALQEEKSALSAKEKEARAALEAATEDGILYGDKVSADVLAASTMIATIEGRRGYIVKNLRNLAEILRKELRLVDNCWTAHVRANGNQIAARYYRAVAPFWPDGGQPHHEMLPLWQSNNRAIWQGSPCELTEENTLSTINFFMELVSEHTARLDLTLAEQS